MVTLDLKNNTITKLSRLYFISNTINTHQILKILRYLSSLFIFTMCPYYLRQSVALGDHEMVYGLLKLIDVYIQFSSLTFINLLFSSRRKTYLNIDHLFPKVTIKKRFKAKKNCFFVIIGIINFILLTLDYTY